jgi:polyferredoxin
MPVFNILRYDVDTKELFLFGKVWSSGFQQELLLISTTKSPAVTSPPIATEVAWRFFTKAIIPWIIALSIFPLFGFILGRFFCGWLCPEGALFEWADFLTRKLTGKTSLWKKYSPFGGEVTVDARKDKQPKRDRLIYLPLAILSILVIPPVMGAGLTGYFISPERIWRELINLNPSFGVRAGIIGVSIYILISSIFVRHVLCKYVCAAGLMQILFGWISPFSLRLIFLKEDARRCTDCKRCEEVCFMNVKPRKNNRDISCVNCGLCIEACNKELADVDSPKGLFKLRFGSLVAK